MAMRWRRAVRGRSAVLAAAVTSITITGAVPASADLRGAKVFTQSSSYYAKSDANSSFTGQVNWRNPNKPMAWSFRLSPRVRAIVVGNMTCSARVPSFRGYSDTHVIPPDYLWHSAVPGPHRMDATWYYVLNGKCTFRVNVGGRTGTGSVSFTFNYRFSNAVEASAPGGLQGSVTEPPYATDLRIEPLG